MFDHHQINRKFQGRLQYADRQFCGEGWTKVKLIIKFGDFPENIQWDLKENGATIFSSSATYERGRSTYSDIFYRGVLYVDRCVSGGEYEFEMRSTNNRGLTSSLEDGMYELYTDDVKIASVNGNFGGRSTNRFSLELAPSFSAFGCFSGETLVEVKNKGEILMKSL